MTKSKIQDKFQKSKIQDKVKKSKIQDKSKTKSKNRSIGSVLI